MLAYILLNTDYEDFLTVTMKKRLWNRPVPNIHILCKDIRDFVSWIIHEFVTKAQVHANCGCGIPEFLPSCLCVFVA
jgi:hypothetical protein